MPSRYKSAPRSPLSPPMGMNLVQRSGVRAMLRTRFTLARISSTKPWCGPCTTFSFCGVDTLRRSVIRTSSMANFFSPSTMKKTSPLTMPSTTTEGSVSSLTPLSGTTSSNACVSDVQPLVIRGFMMISPVISLLVSPSSSAKNTRFSPALKMRRIRSSFSPFPKIRRSCAYISSSFLDSVKGGYCAFCSLARMWDSCGASCCSSGLSPSTNGSGGSYDNIFFK